MLTSGPDYAADGVGVCGTIRVAETAVAMLINQPIVKIFATSAAVLLLLDTSAEATVLTPAAAQRIGAQHPRIEMGETDAWAYPWTRIAADVFRRIQTFSRGDGG
jgi:hypothetical protein